MSAPALERLELGLRMVADAVAELRTADEWVDQKASPLGRRAHLEAVRRGDLPGHKVAGRVLVRKSDLDAYIARHPVRPRVRETDEVDEATVAAIINFKAPRRRRTG